MTEVYVSSAEQMKQVHKSGSENKTTAATRMNERSSRSHSIFILNVHQKDTKTETTKQSKYKKFLISYNSRQALFC